MRGKIVLICWAFLLLAGSAAQAVRVGKDELTAEFFDIKSVGPVAQADLSTFAAPPATILTTVTWTSPLIYADGFKALSVGVQLDQAGTVQIVRYVDAAGLVPQTAVTGTVLAGGTPNVYNVNDGLPFQSFKVLIHNTSGSTANVTNYVLLMNAN
jgi:hypothetical protein